MFRLDDQFLKDIGLEGLPDEQKKPFLQHIYSELELRVGTRLSDGLSDAQLEEFEHIIDRNEDKIRNWLGEHAPNYQQDEAFAKLQQSSGLDVNSAQLIAEYTATKWLEVNRPDYRQVVATVLDELKKEITANREAILGGMQAEAGNQQPQGEVAQPPEGADAIAEQPVQQSSTMSQHDGMSDHSKPGQQYQ